mgnify:CR=1 FL=1
MEVSGADLEELLDHVEKHRETIVFNKAAWLYNYKFKYIISSICFTYA